MAIDVPVMTSLIGVAGLAFAALLSSIGYIYRGRVESKRSARKVLYILLEIRHALGASLFNSKQAKNQYIRHYIGKLKEKGVDVGLEDIDPYIGSLVEEHLSRLANASKADIKDRLIQPFEEALSELSQVSPVLAYSLRGKEKLELIAKLNSSYLGVYKSEFIDSLEEDLARTIMLDFAQEMEAKSVSDMLESLDYEIAVLSRHCGWMDSYRCRGVLSRKFGEFDKEAMQEIDFLIDSLMKKVNSVDVHALK